MREGKKPDPFFTKNDVEDGIDEYYFYNDNIVRGEICDEEMTEVFIQDDFNYEKIDLIFEKYLFRYLKKEKIRFLNNSFYYEVLSSDFLSNYFFKLLILNNEVQIYIGSGLVSDYLILGNFENPVEYIPQVKHFSIRLTNPLIFSIFFEHGALYMMTEQSSYKEKKLLLNPIEIELFKKQTQEFKEFLKLVERGLEF